MKKMRIWTATGMVIVLLCTLVLGTTAAPLDDAGGTVARSMQDALILYQAVAGRREASISQIVQGDYDHDGVLSMRDSMRLYKTVSGDEELREIALGFEATYIDAAMGRTVQTPAVITTAQQWQAFREAYMGEYQPFGYFGEIAVPEKALIPVKLPEHAYIAAVTSDDTTVYVAAVTMRVAETAMIESNRYALVEVDPSAVGGKTVTVVEYATDATLVTTENTTTYAAPMAPGGTEACDHKAVCVFDSVAAQKAYMETAHVTETVNKAMYDAYDEAFYEEYVLVELYAEFPVPSTELCAEALVVTDEVIQVLVTHEASTLPMPTILEYAHLLVPISREIYNGQEITAQMHAMFANPAG